MTRRRFDREEINLLSTEEVQRLLPYGREAIRFGRVMGLVALMALIVGGFAFIYHIDGLVTYAISCFVSFVAFGTIGEEMKFRRFLRLTAEAIDKHKNGTP